ncbi:hypothetical protein [Rubrivirga sp.]|uniref:hypothetical protein n=1 Tax=Rubrivirga sp. TaxID=1885344 RepID=UPI003C77076E
MGFFEALIAFTSVVALFVVMPWIVIQGIVKIRSANRSSSATELRRSDLEAIVAEAVEDATSPLIRRLETLEAIVTDESDLEVGPSRLDAAVLADALGDLEDDVDGPAAVARRARS